MIGDVSLKLGRRTFSARLEYDSLIGRGLRSVGRRLEAKRGFPSAEATTEKAPTFTVAETIEDVTVEVDVPGHALQDLRLDVTPRRLRLRAGGRQGRSGGIGGPIDSSFDLPEPVDPDKVTALRVFVTLPKDRLAEAAEGFQIIAEDRQGHERDVYSANFNTPGAK